MNFPFDIVMVPLQIIIFLFTVYFFFIGLFLSFMFWANIKSYYNCIRY